MHTKDFNNLLLSMFNIDKPNGNVPWKFIAFMKKTGAPVECFLHARSVLSKFNTGLIMRLLHLLYDIKVIIIFQYRTRPPSVVLKNFEFIVSEQVQVNPDN